MLLLLFFKGLRPLRIYHPNISVVDVNMIMLQITALSTKSACYCIKLAQLPGITSHRIVSTPGKNVRLVRFLGTSIKFSLFEKY